MAKARLVSETESETHIVRRYESGDGFAMTVYTEKAVDPLPIREIVESPRILPGSTFANAAARDGQEDEYSNGMAIRYDGEW